jgi:hypothetical protein
MGLKGYEGFMNSLMIEQADDKDFIAFVSQQIKSTT